MAHKLITITALLWLAAGSVSAEEETAAERYTVEIIVFRHLDQSRNTPETPAPSSMVPDSPLELQVDPLRSLSGDSLAGMTKRAPRIPIEFHVLALDPQYPAIVRLDETNYQLGSTVARLQRIDAYEPLAHKAWIHLAQGSEQAQPYTLNTELAAAGEVTGSVTLYKERYVHLELDLALTLPAATQVTETVQVTEIQSGSEIVELEIDPATDDRGNQFTAAVTPDEQYQLQESRRVRNGELHYFDHPQFGVIAVVQVIETRTEDDSDNGRN